MISLKNAILIGVVALTVFVFGNALYTVSEVEQVIITQFGKPVGDPVMSAGLKLKVPFIQEVNPIEKRVLEWDGDPSDMPTKDKLYISVDLYARWRITDPLQYFLRLRDERSAQSRLDDILGSETRNAVAKHELIEIIRTTKDREPQQDKLLTSSETAQKIGTLGPYARAGCWLRKKYSTPLLKRCVFLVLSYWIFDLNVSTTTRAYDLRYMIA